MERLLRRFAPRNDGKKRTRNDVKKGTRTDGKKGTRNDGKRGECAMKKRKVFVTKVVCYFRKSLSFS